MRMTVFAAAPLISLPAAAVTAVGESLLLVMLLRYLPVGLDQPIVGVALVAMWATLGLMVATYLPVRQVALWSWEHAHRAQLLLEEARDRKAELSQALDDLAHANRQLVLMNDRVTSLRLVAEEAQKAKTRFVARVSHEFRTPLNMIIGLVDLMVGCPEMYDAILCPRMRDDLRVVHRNSEHLSSMIDDVLDLTRVEADRLVLYKERVDVGEVIDSAVVAVSPLLQSKQLALHTSIPEDLPEVYCDRTRLEQVILNLLSNAARYTEEGGVTVEVGQQDQHVTVIVTDTGPGIRQEDIQRIFEPFCQGTNDIWRDKGGSGLGLSISKRFVELHGGRMWVDSDLGVGTAFTFELPISSPIDRVGRPGHQIKEEWVWRERQSRPGFSDAHYKPRIVICDLTGGLSAALARHSDEVEFVGAQHLNQVSEILEQSAAHALILNAAAPDDLRSLLEEARREAPTTPIIGCLVPRMVERAIALSALGHMTKPVTRADLKGAILATGKTVRRVLVVDDDPDALMLFSRMLQACDKTLEVVTASSGAEALGELRRHPPDLMLLDILMPEMDGWQVLEALARDDGVGEVPTYFVSAQDPADQPPTSSYLLATIDAGLSVSKLLRCSLEVSRLLLQPEEGPGPTPV